MPFIYTFVVYGTQFGDNADQPPNWLIATIGISYFTYRLLDEMDGKQARKTGNASPLGLLFDHGCDSWAIGFLVTITGRVLQVNEGNLIFLYIFECVCLFYFGTLEEYYVGGLHLRPGNGITDGCFPIFGVYAILSYTGNNVMQTQLIAGNENTRISTLVVYFCFFFSLKALAENFYAILYKSPDN